MRKLTYLFAVAAIGGLTSFASVGSASPVSAGLAGAKAVTPVVSDDLVQQVHRWHCRKRYGWYRGHKWWHRHRRACRRYYDDYSYYRPAPFVFGFHFFDDDDFRFRRRHHRKHWDD